MILLISKQGLQESIIQLAVRSQKQWKWEIIMLGWIWSYWGTYHVRSLKYCDRKEKKWKNWWYKNRRVIKRSRKCKLYYDQLLAEPNMERNILKLSKHKFFKSSKQMNKTMWKMKETMLIKSWILNWNYHLNCIYNILIIPFHGIAIHGPSSGLLLWLLMICLLLHWQEILMNGTMA